MNLQTLGQKIKEGGTLSPAERLFLLREFHKYLSGIKRDIVEVKQILTTKAQLKNS